MLYHVMWECSSVSYESHIRWLSCIFTHSSSPQPIRFPINSLKLCF